MVPLLGSDVPPLRTDGIIGNRKKPISNGNIELSDLSGRSGGGLSNSHIIIRSGVVEVTRRACIRGAADKEIVIHERERGAFSIYRRRRKGLGCLLYGPLISKEHNTDEPLCLFAIRQFAVNVFANIVLIEKTRISLASDHKPIRA